MNKLLRANFHRLLRDKLFYLCCALIAIAGAVIPISFYFSAKRWNESTPLDTALRAFVVFVPIVLSFFVALFLGTEYNDGTIRNKLVLGHKRAFIYLANLIVNIVAALVLCLIYLITYVCVGYPLLGGFTSDIMTLLRPCGTCIILMAAFVSVFTLIAMLWQTKAYSTAACILLCFLLIFVGIYIRSSLNEPEYYTGYTITENGVTYSEERVKNPNYLTGTKREVYEFLFDFLPGCQLLQLSNEGANLSVLELYDLIIFTVSTGCGLVLFKRKDLK